MGGYHKDNVEHKKQVIEGYRQHDSIYVNSKQLKLDYIVLKMYPYEIKVFLKSMSVVVPMVGIMISCE